MWSVLFTARDTLFDICNIYSVLDEHTLTSALYFLTISRWCVMFFDTHTNDIYNISSLKRTCIQSFIYIFVAFNENRDENQIQLGRSKQNSKYNFVVAINIHLCIFVHFCLLCECFWLWHGKYGVQKGPLRLLNDIKLSLVTVRVYWTLFGKDEDTDKGVLTSNLE